ncbi:hypothetical protein C4J95_1646 [Pseudomonas orientalis]|nr:hypothetical protein C4J96_1591 [Pseudomonas orientalis]AZE99122.1 hypothetical protein C4J95_1646 [Pseudomonas orientalis]
MAHYCFCFSSLAKAEEKYPQRDLEPIRANGQDCARWGAPFVGSI